VPCSIHACPPPAVSFTPHGCFQFGYPPPPKPSLSPTRPYFFASVLFCSISFFLTSDVVSLSECWHSRAIVALVCVLLPGWSSPHARAGSETARPQSPPSKCNGTFGPTGIAGNFLCAGTSPAGVFSAGFFRLTWPLRLNPFCFLSFVFLPTHWPFSFNIRGPQRPPVRPRSP